MTSTPGYDRDATIAAVTSYYEFLTRMYLPEDSIMYPPPEGWSIPERQTFSPPKDDTVLDLVRHLPYLEPPEDWEEIFIYEKCIAVNYTYLRGTGPHNIDPTPEETLLPSHVVMLGFTPGRNGHYIFIDTKRGTGTLCDFQKGGKGGTELSQNLDNVEGALTRTGDTGEELKEHWREHPTYAISDLFDMLRKQFQDLEVVPHANGEVEFRRFPPGVDTAGDALKAIFRECGWPAEAYRKSDCMRRIRKFDGESDEEDEDDDDE
ncbi:hypothetical protein SLS60_007617 [Paraconiothyrium brasiliense]|uniref:Knr4/Smi1-like domain-containing protein n=1 Tax=Paraconiothyrium brasiliense TaxID=300254 RepID=A0ABR3R628_9PLEO